MSEVRAEVKQVLVFGAGAAEDYSLQGYSPIDTEDIGFDACIYIGPEGEETMDLFDLVVCSATWQARELSSGRWMERFADAESGPIVLGLDVCTMPTWDRMVFESALNRLCELCSPAPDWVSLAARIGRYLAWEWDYRFDQEVNDRHDLPPPPRLRSAE